VRSFVRATSSTPGIIHHMAERQGKFPEGKSPDRGRESGGSKGPKLIKFQLPKGPASSPKKRALMDQFAKETLPVSLEEEMRPLPTSITR